MNKNLTWHGKGWGVEVLFSQAGLSTVILVRLEDDGLLLLDCGDGCTRDLIKRAQNHGLDYPFIKQLKGILISHDHFDHVGGLHTLLGFLRMIGYESQLSVITPKGSLADRIIIEGFEKIYPDSIPFKIDRTEVSGGREIELGSINVTPFDVVHCGSTKKGGIGKPKPALGYKLIYNGEKVVYTGDCGLASNLEPHIRGSDLLLIEGTLKEHGGEIEQRVHLSLDTARSLAGLAKKAFIIHRID